MPPCRSSAAAGLARRWRCKRLQCSRCVSHSWQGGVVVHAHAHAVQGWLARAGFPRALCYLRARRGPGRLPAASRRAGRGCRGMAKGPPRAASVLPGLHQPQQRLPCPGAAGSSSFLGPRQCHLETTFAGSSLVEARGLWGLCFLRDSSVTPSFIPQCCCCFPPPARCPTQGGPPPRLTCRKPLITRCLPI